MVAASTLFTIAVGARRFVVSYWPDDALFYNVVARNIVRGLGSTSDGIAPTNGYHPLWMGVHVLLARAFDDVIVAQVILQGLLLFVALVLLYRYVAALTTPTVALGLCMIAAAEQTYLRVLSSGMETLPAFIALLLVLRSIQGSPWQEMRPRQRWALSAALALLFFSRLDGGVLWVALATLILSGWLGREEPIRRRAIFIVRVLAVPAVLALAYMLGNYVTYGLAMPVSGRIKSVPLSRLLSAEHWHDALLRLSMLFGIDTLSSIRAAVFGGASDAADSFIALFVVLPLTIIGMILCLRRRPGDASLRLLLLYAAAHAFYYTLLQTDSYSLKWAKVPELLLLSVAFASIINALVQRVASRWPRRLSAAPVLGLLMLAAIAYDGLKASRLDLVRDYEVRSADFWEGVEYVRRNIPPSSVIAANNIGFLGYFSRRPVMSVDGLLNSTDYYRNYLRQNRRIEYLKTHGVRYSLNSMSGGIDPVAYLRTYYPGLEADEARVLASFAGGGGDAAPPRNYVLFELRFHDAEAPRPKAASAP